MQHPYLVEFELDGKTDSRKFYTPNAGQAFAACLQKHQGCKLIRATVEGFYGSGHGFTEFQPPPVQREPVKDPRPARALKPKETGCEFPFYNEVVRREA